MFRIGKSVKTERMVTRDWRQENGEGLPMALGFLFFQ